MAMNPPYKKAVALLLCFCLLTPGVSLAIPDLSAINAILPELSNRVGCIKETWQGPVGKTVYLIRDAHDSVAAQKNIAKVIRNLVQVRGVKTVFEEGYEGAVPTDLFFQDIQDPVAREKVSRQLLEELRIGGAEYAHINRGLWMMNSGSKSKTNTAETILPASTTHDSLSTIHDFKLIGADSLRGHLQNILDYRRAAHASEVAQILFDTLPGDEMHDLDRGKGFTRFGWMHMQRRDSSLRAGQVFGTAGGTAHPQS